MYDQLGGGFHRYSTDERWLVPHFEKMLYDNALLSVAYVEAHQVTRRPDFARVARETLDYVLREMTAPDGGFYSATDADSEGEEGKFFVWTPAEIERVLGDMGAEGAETAKRFARYYDVTASGNFEGANILHAALPDEAEVAALAPARQKLYEARKQRIPPLRDDKIIAAWNGLMISALAVGGRVLGEPRYTTAAARAAEFVLARMRQGDRVVRSWKDGRAQAVGFLDDQAFVVAGLLDLHEATFDRRWLGQALALADATERHFADQARGGWFMTAADSERLLAREKPLYDGAEPSGTSIALQNALRLSALTADDRWRSIAARAFSSLQDVLGKRPLAMTEALIALDFFTDAAREIGIVWPQGQGPESGPAGEGARALVAVLRDTFLPNKVVAAAATGPGLETLSKLAPFMAGRVALGGKATGYVCERGRCELPTADPARFAELLKTVKRYPGQDSNH
jgi:hypothetical protein